MTTTNRRLYSHLLHGVTLAGVATFATLALALPGGDTWGGTTDTPNLDAKATNTPTFAEVKDQFPQCDAHTNNLRPKLVMHTDRSVTIMDFDSALAATKDPDGFARAWILGSC